MNNKKNFSKIFESKKITKESIKDLVMESIKTTHEQNIKIEKVKQKSLKLFYGILSLSVLILSFVFLNYSNLHKNLNNDSNDNSNNNNNNNNNNSNDNNSQLEVIYKITKSADYVATSIEDLYKSADLVFIGTKNKDNKTFVGINGLIITESNCNVKEIIKGTYYNNNININYYGGTIRLDEYINSLSEEQIRKKGFNEFDIETRKTKLVGYPLSKTSVLFENNIIEYMIFVNYDQERNMYFVMSDAYGVRKINEVGKVYNLDKEMFETIKFDN
ncbi:MAG: hypothetical protein ACM3O4_05570 [Ignavibacteriales bacterium]